MNVDSYQKPVYLPGGVADTEGNIGYVSNASSGIDAIDVSTGNLFWNTDLAAYPLIVWKNSLVALRFLEANRKTAQVVVFSSSQNGAPFLYSQSIRLPEWITTKIHGDLLFEVYLNQNILILIWNAEKVYEGGAPPPEYIIQRESKQECGKIQIDLITGEVETLPFEEIGDLISETFPSPKEGLFEINAWRTEDNRASLLLDVSSNTPVIYLQRRNNLSKLIEGDGLVTDISSDGLYISVHQEIESQTGNRINDSWLIFSVETGEKVAGLDYEPGTKEFSVINSKIFYSVEKRNQSFLKIVLKAKEIEGGRVLWERLLSEQKLLAPPALLQ